MSATAVLCVITSTARKKGSVAKKKTQQKTAVGEANHKTMYSRQSISILSDLLQAIFT